MASFADKPTLVGPRVTLRPLVATDAPSLLAATRDPVTRRLTGTRAEFTVEMTERWCATRAEQPDRLDLAIVDSATGVWLGELAIMDWSPEDRSCHFRIALDRSHLGRGLGTEATRMVVDYVFEHLPIHRLALDVFSFNERAIATYTKVGFVVEGRQRDALLWDGEYADSILMSMLRPDWEAARPG